MSTVPEEIVPWLQPQATNDPAMVKIPALSEPATEKVYVPFKDELLNAPAGGGVGLAVPLPPPQPANTGSVEHATVRTKRLVNDMWPPKKMSIMQIGAGSTRKARRLVQPQWG